MDVPCEIYYEVYTRCTRATSHCLRLTCKQFSLFSEHKSLPNVRFSTVVAKEGYLNLLQWCELNNYFILGSAVVSAAGEGHLECVEWLWERMRVGLLDNNVHGAACFGGHMEVIKYLDSVRCDSSDYSVTEAARGGKVDVLDYLLYDDEMSSAFVDSLGPEMFRAAASTGQLDTMKYLRDKGHEWHKDTFSAAAGSSCSNTIEMLQWLKREDCPWDEDTFSAAACSGDMRVLKWLKEGEYTWNSSCCTSAAQGGHLRVLKWLRKHGCEWEEEAAAAAAREGNLEMLKWMKESGYPDLWMRRARYSADYRDHDHVAQWIGEIGE